MKSGLQALRKERDASGWKGTRQLSTVWRSVKGREDGRVILTLTSSEARVAVRCVGPRRRTGDASLKRVRPRHCSSFSLADFLSRSYTLVSHFKSLLLYAYLPQIGLTRRVKRPPLPLLPDDDHRAQSLPFFPSLPPLTAQLRMARPRKRSRSASISQALGSDLFSSPVTIPIDSLLTSLVLPPSPSTPPSCSSPVSPPSLPPFLFHRQVPAHHTSDINTLSSPSDVPLKPTSTPLTRPMSAKRKAKQDKFNAWAAGDPGEIPKSFGLWNDIKTGRWMIIPCEFQFPNVDGKRGGQGGKGRVELTPLLPILSPLCSF